MSLAAPVVVVGSLLQLGCGSRTQLRGGPDACSVDEECDQSLPCMPQICQAGACLAVPLECGPSTPCEQLACNPASGQCEPFTLTEDRDGDGHNGPLPGYEAGAEGACGDDCDDTSPRAFPGGTEICDGTDNDCDNIVDNNALFLQFADLPVPKRIAPEADKSSHKGLAYGEGVFAAGYWSENEKTRSSWITGFDEYSLSELWTEQAVLINAESFGGDLVWSGDAFGSTWSDLRFDGNYEVFFNRFNTRGEKLGPDLRVTNAPSFSTQSIVRFDQGRYVLLWSDQRGQFEGIGPQVFAQLLDDQGRLLGENRLVSSRDEWAEGPDLASTPTRFGVIYTDSPGYGQPYAGAIRLKFASFDKEFGDRATAQFDEAGLAGIDVREPRIIAADDLFVMSWSGFIEDRDLGQVPGPFIMGAVVDGRGEIIVEPQPLTNGATFARSSALVSFGDRFMLLWVDDYDGNFELYAQVMDLKFNVIEERTRLTVDEDVTESPIAVRSASGTIGIAFDDWRTGEQQAYFTALECRVPSLR